MSGERYTPPQTAEEMQRVIDDQVARGWVRIVGYLDGGEAEYQITEEGHRVAAEEDRRARRRRWGRRST